MMETLRRPTGAAWQRRKAQVFERDGGLCMICWNAPAIVVDHIVPIALGGTNELANLQAACDDCNSRKAARFDLSNSTWAQLHGARSVLLHRTQMMQQHLARLDSLIDELQPVMEGDPQIKVGAAKRMLAGLDLESDESPSRPSGLNHTLAKRRRLELGLTMAQVGQLCGVGIDVVSRWEAGLREPRNLESLRRYARALQVEVGALASEPDSEVAAS
jgi:5-methylcytosine-specific restriction enzyme A